MCMPASDVFVVKQVNESFAVDSLKGKWYAYRDGGRDFTTTYIGTQYGPQTQCQYFDTKEEVVQVLESGGYAWEMEKPYVPGDEPDLQD